MFKGDICEFYDIVIFYTVDLFLFRILIFPVKNIAMSLKIQVETNISLKFMARAINWQ